MEGLAIRREIAVRNEDRDFLKSLFKVTDRTLRNAFNLSHPTTEVIGRIRKVALERGGEVMVTLREMETIHISGVIMEQRMRNGAVLRFYREDGHGEIWFKGSMVERRENVTVAEIFEMQMAAALR